MMRILDNRSESNHQNIRMKKNHSATIKLQYLSFRWVFIGLTLTALGSSAHAEYPNECYGQYESSFDRMNRTLHAPKSSTVSLTAVDGNDMLSKKISNILHLQLPSIAKNGIRHAILTTNRRSIHLVEHVRDEGREGGYIDAYDQRAKLIWRLSFDQKSVMYVVDASGVGAPVLLGTHLGYGNLILREGIFPNEMRTPSEFSESTKSSNESASEVYVSLPLTDTNTSVGIRPDWAQHQRVLTAVIKRLIVKPGCMNGAEETREYFDKEIKKIVENLNPKNANVKRLCQKVSSSQNNIPNSLIDFCRRI